MRLPLLSPAGLSPEQKALYDDMRAGIATAFNAFKTEREDGALIGPWNASLHHPSVGRATWDLTKAVLGMASLPTRVKEVAILVVGGHYKAAFEIQAHLAVAARTGMSPGRSAQIVAGAKPLDLSHEESIAFDVAVQLCDGGALPEATYQSAVATFGASGASQLVYLVGLYCLISVTLNGFDVPIGNAT
jgi:4-carboxymuconolactone decarboxylase